METRVNFDDFTAFIGRNDAGKSTILEALEIFFNGAGSALVKIETADACVHSGDQKVLIGCVFSDLPEELVLDAQTITTLQDEYLLNEEGDLEIHKIIDCGLKSPKETVYAHALHPTAEPVKDLLELTNAELKERAKLLAIDLTAVDKRSNPALRRALRMAVPELGIRMVRLPLGSKDAKAAWESIVKHLPQYALFQADRPSRDEDSEVQDPMKIAVAEAIRSVEETLNEIKEVVRVKVTEVATRTLDKLREMDPFLANELSPHFKAEPKWDGLFKLSLTGDNQIPVNKRGSGVRRLILLNFFRAEAERRQLSAGTRNIIYGIEEPETAQHPANQKMLVTTLRTLAQEAHCQVVITTHVPGLAGFLETSTIRYVEVKEGGARYVRDGDDTVLREIAEQLGVLPDSRVRVFVCVEGPNDVSFLKHISRTLHSDNPMVPNLESDPRIALFHLGGSTLKDWVQNHYLRGLGIPEVHIYDRDEEKTPRYKVQQSAVNARGDGSVAFITGKREAENYLHPDAIFEVYNFTIGFADSDDLPLLIAQKVHEDSESHKTWDLLSEEKKKGKISRAKAKLNNEVAARMNIARLRQSDPEGDIQKWFGAIAAILELNQGVMQAAPVSGQ